MKGLISYVKKHKKKFIFVVFFFGGCYISVKYVINKITEKLLFSSNNLPISDEYFFKLKKKEHYLTIKQTSDNAVIDWIKSILEKINNSLSTKELLDELKQKPSNKLEIWEKIKILSISKCMVTIYAIAMLTLFFKIELNIIGAFLFLRNTKENSQKDEKIKIEDQQEQLSLNRQFLLTPTVQQNYFENIENFVKKGIPNLIEKIKNLCEVSFENLSLKEIVTIDMLGERFESIQNQFQYKYNHTNIEQDDSNFNEFINKKFVLEYLMFKEDKYQLSESLVEIELDEKEILEENNEEVFLNELNTETFDLLSCGDFQLTFSSLVKLLSNELLNNLTRELVKQIGFPNQANNKTTEKILIGLPLAKLIPLLDNYNLYYEANNKIFDELLSDLKLNIFSANIYESFSYTSSTSKLIFNE